jgi:hypothetical protein
VKCQKKMFMFKSVLLYSLVYFSHAAETDVIELSDNDFAARISEHETVLVMFYAPW